jgi:hypothetical protein
MCGPRMRNPRRRGFTLGPNGPALLARPNLESEGRKRSSRSGGFKRPSANTVQQRTAAPIDVASRVAVRPGVYLPGEGWAGHHRRLDPILGTSSGTVPTGARTG